jgi:hypothetical protein
MPQSPRSIDATKMPAVPRRTLVAGAAWSVPVIAAAGAAPAYAASLCLTTDYDYVLNWGSTTSPLNRTSATQANANATSGTGSQALNVGFASALITSGPGNNNVNGYVLDPTYNLSVPGPSSGGVLPNVTNLGNIVPNGSERGLCLQHTSTTTAGVNNQTGNPNRGQRLTITFPRAVTNLTFWIVDIDSTTNNGYWDRVRFTTAPTVIAGSASANINGTGFGTTPFRYGNAATNSNIDENTSGARVRVRFPGPLTTLTMEYWNAAGTGIQRMFLHDLEFKAKGC